MGYKTVKLGDIDGDGLSDFAISTIDLPTMAGRVGIFFGRRDSRDWPANLTLGRADVVLTGEISTDVANGDRFGENIAGEGDFNGDGYGDIVIGAPCNDNSGRANAGKIYVVFGRSRAGWSMISGSITRAADITLLGENSGDQMGPVALGDFNGDRISDLVIGAPGYDPIDPAGYGRGANYGKIYLLYGSTAWRSSSLSLSISSVADLSYGIDVNTVIPPGMSGSPTGFFYWFCFGKSLSFVGDLNGDGFNDLVVGAPGSSSFWYVGGGVRGYFVYGRVIIFPGNNRRNLSPAYGISGDTPVHAVTTLGGGLYQHYYFDATNPIDGANTRNENRSFGEVISKAGDIDHDGYADFWVGYGARPFFALIKGAASIPSMRINATFEQSNQFYNISLSSGDVNGDGWVDLLVGSPHFNSSSGSSGEGQAYLLRGGLRDWTTIANIERNFDVRFISESYRDQEGKSVAFVGDVNGDAIEDIVIGADGYSGTAIDAGRAHLIFGSRTGGIFSSVTFEVIEYYSLTLGGFDPRPWPYQNSKITNEDKIVNPAITEEKVDTTKEATVDSVKTE